MEGNLNSKQDISKNRENSCFSYFNYIESQVSKNLKLSCIETRPAKTNGLWCCLLLPSILLGYNVLYKISPVYTLTSYVSLGLFVQDLLVTVFISISPLVLLETTFGGCIACTLISALLVYYSMEFGLFLSLAFTAPAIFGRSILFKEVLRKFPKTFTIGEAGIVVNSIVLFLVMSVAKLSLQVKGLDNKLDFVNTIIYIGFLTVGLTISIMFSLDKQHHTPIKLVYVAAGVVFVMMIFLHALLGATVLLDFTFYISMNKIRAQLFCYWLALLLIAVVVICYRVNTGAKADTSVRKSFHVLASLVFIPGLLLEQDLMRLAAGVAFALLIFAEALRKMGIEPISSVLQNAFDIYSDEKDIGGFAMTPIYLFTGLACPLLLVPRGIALERLAGVLSVGVGDTAASVVGSKFGRNKWPDSKKTIEGTIANIGSQLLVVYILELIGILKTSNALLRTAIAASISSWVEATTDQVDNLILPLVTILSYQITFFL